MTLLKHELPETAEASIKVCNSTILPPKTAIQVSSAGKVSYTYGLTPATFDSCKNHKAASSTRLCFDGDYYRLGAYVPLPLGSESTNYKEVIKNW